jgi:hypothetical protein
VLHIHDLDSGAAMENVTEEVIYSFNDLREERTDKYQNQRSYKLHASSQLYDKLRMSHVSVANTHR